MPTTDDFIGASCPACGARDTLEADEARGEVACTSCARVVAMGLEENMLTRWEKDATFEDADRHAWQEGGGFDGPLAQDQAGGNISGSDVLLRSSAAAMAAGIAVKNKAPLADPNTEEGRRAKYARTVLHPKIKQFIENLCRVSRRADDVKFTAMSIAKTFFGYRREHGIRTTQQAEVAAACFLLATELNEEPVPLAELRVLDPSLKNVELSRREVVTDTNMVDTERRLRGVFAPNLLRHYLRMLHLQMRRYEPVGLALLRALVEVARPASELAQLTEADRVVAAVLLLRTEDKLQWEGKPPYDPAREPSPATAYASFAASAHLEESRVLRVMQVVRREVEAVGARLAALLTRPREGANGERSGPLDTAEGVRKEAERDGSAATAMGTPSEKVGSPAETLLGVKRPRGN